MRFSWNKDGNRVFIKDITFVQCASKNWSKVHKATLYFEYATYYALENVVIDSSAGYGLCTYNCREQVIKNCSFLNNTEGHIQIWQNLDYCESDFNVGIAKTEFHEGNFEGGADYGVSITSHCLPNNSVTVIMEECTFVGIRNGGLQVLNSKHVEIKNCSFRQNYIRRNMNALFIKSNSNSVIKDTVFKENKGINYHCSLLNAHFVTNLSLSNVDIVENNCTGITLTASNATIESEITLERNIGLRAGGILLKGENVLRSYNPYTIFTPAKMIFNGPNSKVVLVNNQANKYGGAIHSVQTCQENRCFFELNTAQEVFRFLGNTAKYGGDMLFGTCLSNCTARINGTKKQVNITDPDNIIWDLMSYGNITSQSMIAEQAKKVSFCDNSSSELNIPTNNALCSGNYSLRSYVGKIFSVSLMVVDDHCSPSVATIHVDYERSLKLLHGEKTFQSRKYCHTYSFAISGQHTTEVKFSTIDQLSFDAPPAVLTIQFEGCPIGYEFSSPESQCKCKDILTSFDIKCLFYQNSSFEIPVNVWIGRVDDTSNTEMEVGLQDTCLYCKDSRRQIVTSLMDDSDELCFGNRTGVMCGQCIEGYSLQLGGYKCADCSGSTLKGVVLVLVFVLSGIALVLLLLYFNLTVSTGTVNGFIFYSNIVYLNSDNMLPLSDQESTHLQNAVKILSTLQAWVNLDFGIVTCFFDGYSTYISAWMQFAFPLYIWCLVLLIVLASRYSKRVAKLTRSNTVPVLATLLLLSYTKLLHVCVKVSYFTRPFLLNGVRAEKIRWTMDANILYLQGAHLLLFLMALLMGMFYLIPFTLLILMGPLLQAKSHLKVLHWTNSYNQTFL